MIRLPNWMTVFSQPLTPSVFREVKKLVSEADAVQMHTPNPLFEFAYLFCKPGVPFVVTYHCEVMKKRPLVRFYEPVSRAVLDRADSVVIATKHHLEYSRWLKDYSHKCKVIPFGIKQKYGDKTLAINEKLKAIKERIPRYFLFIGRMVSYKGVDVLLKAVQDIDQELVLIGQGPLLEEWKQLAQSLGISDRVHFLGQVDCNDEFAAYIHGCDALVLPSINEAEAFGLVLLEAMSCGRPVITTELNSGVRFVNKAGETGLVVPPSNSEALSYVMNKLARDNELRLKMGAAAYERFLNNFVVDDFVDTYMNLYQNVISASKAA